MAQESSRSARGVSRRPCLFSLSKGWRKAAGVSADDTIGRHPGGGSIAGCCRAGVTECNTLTGLESALAQSPYKRRPFLLCLPFLFFSPSYLHGTGGGTPTSISELSRPISHLCWASSCLIVFQLQDGCSSPRAWWGSIQ